MSNDWLTDDVMSGLFSDDENLSVIKDVTRGTTGSAFGDFFGQMTWGAADELALGTFDMWDAYKKGTAGSDYYSWEDMLTVGSDEAEWNELTNWGRAGNIIGRGFGMIPSFLYGGFIGKGLIRGGSKLLGWASPKLAPKAISKSIAADDLIKAANIIPDKAGVKGVTEALQETIETTTDEGIKHVTKAAHIVDEAFDAHAASNALNQLYKEINQEAMDEAVTSALVKNIDEVLQIGDEEITTALAKELNNIVKHQNPEDMMRYVTNLWRKVPGIGGREYMPHILAASTYDAFIGVGMGTIHTVVNAGAKGFLGTERDEMRQWHYTGNRDVSVGGIGKMWLHEASTSAWHFSLIGPVKFWKGGTTTNYVAEGRKMLYGMTKAWKPLKNYKNKELRDQLSIMDELSGGMLNSKAGKKFASMGDKWWVNATTDADTELMQGMLKYQ